MSLHKHGKPIVEMLFMYNFYRGLGEIHNYNLHKVIHHGENQGSSEFSLNVFNEFAEFSYKSCYLDIPAIF